MTDDILKRLAPQVSPAKLLSQISGALVAIDFDGRVIFWNQGAERLYGRHSEEMLGQPLFASHASTKLSGEGERRMRDAVRRNGAWSGDDLQILRDGRQMSVELEVSLLHDDADREIGYLAQIRELVAPSKSSEAPELEESAPYRGHGGAFERQDPEARELARDLMAILDAMPAATFIAHDAECRNMTSSRAAYELLRLPYGTNTSKSAPMGERPETFRFIQNGRELAPEELPIQKAAATGLPIMDAELTIVFNDKTSYDLLGNAVPLRNDAGEVRGAVGAFINVSERNRIGESRRHQEAILRAVLDGTTDYVFMKDCAGRYLSVNSAVASAVGLTPAEMLGKDDYALFPPEIAERIMRDDSKVITTEQSFTFEEELRTGGQLRHLNTVKGVCRDAEGRVIGVVGISRDVTDRKQLELVLREREHELTEAHRIAKLGTWHWNCRTDTVTWSKEIYRTFQYDPKLPAPAFQEQRRIYTPESTARLQAAVNRTIGKGEPYELDLELNLPDGTTKWIIARGEVETRVNGQVEQLRGTIQEITERKRSEERLAISENRYRSLVASITHEINNPLAAVTYVLYLALKDDSLSDATRNYLKTADQKLERIASVTNQTLQFQKQSNPSTQVDLGELMDSVFAVYAPRFKASSVTVKREYRLREKLECRFEEMRQVFSNLMSNSLDATAGGGRVRIRLRETRTWDDDERPGIKVTVACTGQDVSSETKKRLLEPYASGKDAAGLDLWVAAGIVRSHGGRMRARSRSDSSQLVNVIALFFPFDGAQLEAGPGLESGASR